MGFSLFCFFRGDSDGDGVVVVVPWVWGCLRVDWLERITKRLSGIEKFDKDKENDTKLKQVNERERLSL